jgi:hypothetical protein
MPDSLGSRILDQANAASGKAGLLKEYEIRMIGVCVSLATCWRPGSGIVHADDDDAVSLVVQTSNCWDDTVEY